MALEPAGEIAAAMWGPVPVELCPFQEAKGGGDEAATKAVLHFLSVPLLWIKCSGMTEFYSEVLLTLWVLQAREHTCEPVPLRLMLKFKARR